MSDCCSHDKLSCWARKLLFSLFGNSDLGVLVRTFGLLGCTFLLRALLPVRGSLWVLMAMPWGLLVLEWIMPLTGSIRSVISSH